MAIQCLALSPHFADDQTLYAGSEADGIYLSHNGGANWQPLSDDLRGQSINALAVLPAGTGLLAGTGSGLYRSGKDGQDWQLTPGGEFLALALAVDAAGALLAATYGDGVYGAENADAGWRSINAGLVAHSPPVAQLRGDDTLWLLDTTGALVCSADWGASWQAQNQTVGNQPVFALATNSKHTAAATATGLWFNRTGEQTWQPRALPTAQATRLLLLSPQYEQDHTLLLGDDEQRLYLSQNDGADWQALPAPWVGEELLQVAFSPTGDQALLVMTVRHGAADPHYRLQLWRSLPASVNFISLAILTTELPAAALLWPVDPLERAFFLATQHRVIKLTPRASDGELAATQCFLPLSTNITALAASPTFAQDDTLYAATNRGLYISTDRGATWALLDNELAERLLVAILPGGQGG